MRPRGSMSLPWQAGLLVLAAGSLACGGGKLTPVEVVLVASPSEVDFGWVEVAKASRHQVVVRNDSVVPVDVELVFQDGEAFSVESKGLRLEAFTEGPATVVFRPLYDGEYTSVLRVRAGSAESEVPLSGRAYFCEGSPGCGIQRFDPETGTCEFVPGCDDGNACTEDVCAEDGSGCEHRDVSAQCPAPSEECRVPVCDPSRGCDVAVAPDGAPCGESCNRGTCQAGVCVSTVCDDGNACTRDSCDLETGTCRNDDLTSECRPANACVAAMCEPHIGCVQSPLPDGEPCGKVTCSGLAECFAGTCVNMPPPDAGCGCDEAPVPPPRLMVGYGQVCRITSDEHVECWGMPDALGDGTPANSISPSPVRASGLAEVVGIYALSTSVVAQTREAGAWWWGTVDATPSGDELVFHDRPAPLPYFQEVRGASSFAVGVLSPCLFADGDLWCWGYNCTGEFGDGTLSPEHPACSTWLTTTWQRVSLDGIVSASLASTRRCVVLDDSTVRCWGANGEGDLGGGPHGPRLVLSPEPARLADGRVLRGAVEVSAGAPTCIRTIYGEVYCAGHYSHGMQTLPYFKGPYFERIPLDGCPAQISTSPGGFAQVACVRMTDASVRCFGRNAYGALGNPDAGVTWSDASGIADVDEVRTNGMVTCTALSDAGYRCWGSNGSGELGDGTFVDRWVP